MTEPSVFTKKHATAMAQDRRAILEELNLPPAAIEFIRANAGAIQAVFALFIVILLGWEGYGKYVSVQRDRSADMLYQAMKVTEPEQQITQLKALSSKYGKDYSGIWGGIEQGHLAFKEGKFKEAATQYEAILGSLDKKSPVYALIQYSLGQAYENLPDQAKAKSAYQALSAVKGFDGEALLGLARIAELEGKTDEALAKFKDYVALPETKDGPTKDWAKNKIQLLTPQKGK